MLNEEYIKKVKIPVETCIECSGKTIHNMKYDAYFCKHCDIWRETTCKDPVCEFCSHRPERPSHIQNTHEKPIIGKF